MSEEPASQGNYMVEIECGSLNGPKVTGVIIDLTLFY
jgi:hypothetical protein